LIGKATPHRKTLARITEKVSESARLASGQVFQQTASGLGAVQGRPGVYVIPNETPLDLTGRILNSGKVPVK
jgi:hypothetical protein